VRILQVCPRYPPQTGGVERHVMEISERLQQRGHEVTVLTADAGRAGGRREQRKGVDVRRYRGLAPGEAFHLAPGIGWTVRRLQADVVHAHNYHSLPMLFAALGRSEASFVATTHYHGASSSVLRNRLLRLYRPVGGRVLQRADAVVAVSDWERARLTADFGVAATVIPNGVDIARFAEIDPEVRDRPFLLSVGRLESYKGIQSAIAAMDQLPDYELVVVGEGPDEAALRQRAATAGLHNRVTFLGRVDDQRLRRLYRGATAHITLSSFEAFGITVAESLAADTPCVVRTAGPLREWLENPGVEGVERTDPATIARAVEAAAKREPNRHRVLDWSVVTDRYESVYSRLPRPEAPS
jgi:glycosyltransferase involved in cell wall biosynthesis